MTVRAVEMRSKLPMPARKINDGVDNPLNKSSWECHYAAANDKEAAPLSPPEEETDSEMDIHKISVKSSEVIDFNHQHREKNDGGVTAILAATDEAGSNGLSSVDIELLNVI